MKRVKFGYGLRALGDYKGEMFVPEDMTEEEIMEQIKEDSEFYMSIYEMEDGYEETTKVVYKKKN